MLQKIINLVDPEYFKGIFFAVFGGFIRILKISGTRKIKIKLLISGLFTSAFIGIVIMELCEYYQISSQLAGAVVAMSGFLHIELIEVLTAKFLKKVEEKINE